MKKTIRTSIITIIVMGTVLAAFSLSNCTRKGTPEPAAMDFDAIKPVDKIPYRMVVSVDIIRELGYMFTRTRSTKAVVLVEPGMNPMTYVPTEEDEKAVLEADVFFYMGLGLEPGLAPMIDRVKDKVRCIAVTSGLDRELLLKSGSYPGGYDPHIWWGPDVWEKFLRHMTKIFVALDPEGEYKYASIYLRYGESTNQFNHRFMKLWMDAIPEERRYLVTLHPAFSYLNRLYGITVKSILDPYEDQYSETRINELADFIISHKIPVIFPEATYSMDPLLELKEATAKKGYDVAIGPEIYSYFLAQDMEDRNYIYLGAGRTMGRAIYDALKTREVPGVPD